MRIIWVLLSVVLLASCSADYSAREPFPKEQEYTFDAQFVEALQLEQIQKLYSSSNKLVFYLVTTYEQAAFLKRNAAYLSVRTVPENFEFPQMKLTLLERFEIEDGVYYGLRIQVEGTGLAWLEVPPTFSTIELLLAQKPFVQLEIGTVAFRKDGTAYVDRFSMEQLQPVAQMLHERQK